MMSELEQDIAAEIEGWSGTTQELLIKLMSGGEKCFLKKETKLQSCGENQMGAA